MEIKSNKKIVSSIGKNNAIRRNKIVEQHAVLTKAEAVEELKDLYEFLYEMIDENILNDKKMELDQREQFEKIRNRMGIYKECQIIIKN